MSDTLTTIEAEIHAETDKAVKVSIDGNPKAATWLPLSAIELTRRRTAPHVADITLTERMALAKGLI